METVTIHNEILPKGWNVKKLGDLSDITTGSKDVNEGNPKGQYPFFTCSRDVHASDSYSFDTEAILVAGNGVVGETKYYKGKFEAYQRTYVLSNFKVNPLFLYFYLKGKLVAELHRHISGSTMPYIKRGDLEGIEVPVPLNNEQQTIATILSKIQEAIENQDKILQTTTELKTTLMRKLFSEGLNDEPLKQTEIGKIPKSWKVKTLKDVVDIVYGAQAAVAHQTDSSIGTPILTNINITNDGKIDTSTLRYYKIPEKKKERLTLKKGDILFNWRSGSKEHVGKTAIFDLDGKYTFASFILRFRVTDKTDSRFLYYFLQHLKALKYFSQYRDQSSVNSVFNASAATKIPIVLPELHEQVEIVEILSAVDAKIENAKKLTSAKTDLFKSMLNNLISGETRVNNITL